MVLPADNVRASLVLDADTYHAISADILAWYVSASRTKLAGDLERDRVDSFLQHLNSRQPTIRFTMGTENDSKIAFLGASVSREPGRTPYYHQGLQEANSH